MFPQHRAPSAHVRLTTGIPAAAALPPQSYGVRSASPRAMGKPDFRDGSTIEERDARTGRPVARFRVGALLGRGGFAKCYAFTDLETGKSYACKVIDRASLKQSKTLQKLHSEIAIHKRMKHKNIVNYYRNFQDEYFVYILLEKCTNQTLMEVAKSRRRFSVAETQFIMIQTIAAIQYMHENNVIHRDLKLGNMMLDSDMNVKLGDFGLAAELQYDGERKRTICGTPNYIAPEILDGAREGHSFEVDIWSLGVILYTLLVGEPPFQTTDVRQTYNRIRQCRYTFPPNVELSESGRSLIHAILQSCPDRRPTLMDIRADAFFRSPVPPTVAPATMFPDALRRQRERMGMEPVPSGGDVLAQRDVNELPRAAKRLESPTKRPSSPAKVFSARSSAPTAPMAERQPMSARPRVNSNPPPMVAAAPPPPAPMREAPKVGGWLAGEALAAPRATDRGEDDEINRLHDRLHKTLLGDEVLEDKDDVPLLSPTAWVTSYADFSQKYGLAYRMNTGHTGVHYNDSTKMAWEPVTNRVEYYSRIKETINGVVHAQDSRSSFHMDSYPEPLQKKVTLIKYFKSYLTKGKRDGIEVVACSPYTTPTPVQLTEPHMTAEMIYVKRWLQTPQAMIFRLSNRTIQVCFTDRTEVILSSESKVITFTEPTGARRTIPLAAVATQPSDVADRLKFTKDILHRLINNKEL